MKKEKVCVRKPPRAIHGRLLKFIMFWPIGIQEEMRNFSSRTLQLQRLRLILCNLSVLLHKTFAKLLTIEKRLRNSM